MNFSIVHQISNRMRLRANKKLSRELALFIADSIENIEGVFGVEVNPFTGSVLVFFENKKTQESVLLFFQKNMHSFDEKNINLTSFANTEDLPQEKNAIQKPSMNPFLVFAFVRPLLPIFLRTTLSFFRAVPYVIKAIKAIKKYRLNADVLDAAAIIISLIQKDYTTASILMLLLGFGEALESWTRKVSLSRLTDSLDITVSRIWVLRGNEEVQISMGDLQKGDLVIVRAGSSIPVDGIVEDGNGLVNQATMTGESSGVLRDSGSTVFAGTVVEEGELFIRATQIGDETRLNKIVRYIESSEKAKAGMQTKTDRLADIAVPFTFLLAGITYFITRDIQRASSVLLVDYSCALRLATPLALLTAMRKGTDRNVIIKGGRFIEALNDATTVVFDKTGTLTKAEPHLTEVIAADGYSREEILRIAACLEEHFPHPLARAVVKKAEEENLKHAEEHAKVEYVVAHGIASTLHEKRVVLGSHHYVFHDEKIPLDALQDDIKRLTDEGLSVLYLAISGKLCGILAIEDTIRDEAKDVIKELHARKMRVIMLTGDSENTAKAISKKLGIKEYKASVLPTEKSDVINELRAQGEIVVMVGDGMNDAAALSTADVSVSLKDGADLAQEVAGVVLTQNNLADLLTALNIGKSTMRLIKVNYGATLGLNSLFLAGGLSGLLTPTVAAVLHNSTTVGVCLNAMRLKV